MKELFVVLVNHLSSTLQAMILLRLKWVLSVLGGGGLLLFLNFDALYILQLVSDRP
jgi:hypothetical protein